MNLATVMEQLATQLATITNLNTFAYPPDMAHPPAAIVVWPDEIRFDDTYLRGKDSMTIPVLVIVGKVSDRSSMAELGDYASGSGSRSIKAVLEAGTYTAMNTVRVTRAEFIEITLAGVPYNGAWFEVDISGSGT